MYCRPGALDADDHIANAFCRATALTEILIHPPLAHASEMPCRESHCLCIQMIMIKDDCESSLFWKLHSELALASTVTSRIQKFPLHVS